MKCSVCGAEITDSSGKCGRCGTAAAKSFNYRNMEDELVNTVLETENMIGISSSAASYQEDDGETESEGEAVKQWGRLGAALLAGAAVFAAILFGLQSFSDEYSYESKEAEYQKCLLSMVQEDYKGARKSVDLLLQDDESNLEYLSLKNTICRKAKDKDEQIQVLKQIMAADPDNYQAYEQILELYVDKADQKEIMKLAENAPNSIISSMIKEYLVNAPYLELTPGVYDTSQTLEISSEQGYHIYYTLDGSSPQKKGIPYIKPIPLESGQSYTVTAICKNDKGIYGEETTGEYQIGINTPAQ